MKKVAVTGAAGQIAYSLLFRIAAGDLLGREKVHLSLLDLPSMRQVLEGVRMELEDGAYPVLETITCSSKAEEAFEGADLVILLGAKPRGPGMERRDLLSANGLVFVEQGKALNRSASADAHVLVVGNPCNTNAWIARYFAPRLNPLRFYAMTRLDQNRAIFLASKKAGCRVEEVHDLIVWGNHSQTQVPDFVNAKIGRRALCEVIQDRHWLEGEFVSQVRQRGAAVIRARGKSSAGSAAEAALLSMRSVLGLHDMGKAFSLGVTSVENPYGIEEDLIFSYPCRGREGGCVDVVRGWVLDAFLDKEIRLSEAELVEERDLLLREVI
jgi:malate dehydrogenase